MSAPFVALALSYCLGKGKINLLGSRRRPWLEIKRRETELTYLNHQAKQLRLLHDGPLQVVIDTVPTDGFYDDKRLRCHGENLYRAYELLYPRDEKTWSNQVFRVVGKRGLPGIWGDCGRVVKGRAQFSVPGSPDRARLVRNWLADLGYEMERSRLDLSQAAVTLTRRSSELMIQELRVLLPRHMMHTLRG